MAKIKHIIIALLTALSFCSYCQVAVYETPNELVGLEVTDGDSVTTHRLFRLSLDEDNFVLESVPGVVFSYDSRFNSTDTIVLSFGKYAKHENELQMVDNLNGFSMLAFYDAKGGLRFCQGLAVTIGKTFLLQSTNDIQEVKMALPKANAQPLDFDKYRNQDGAKPLKLGFYDSGIKKFELKEDGSYVYCNGFPIDTISVGRWSQEGNLLAFRDKGLNEPFYACIEDRIWKINGNAMPGAISNAKLDGRYTFTGYDIDGPTKMDEAKPMVGEHFLNASFCSELDEDHRVVIIWFFGNEYSIEQVQYMGDIIPVHTVSYGTYCKEGNRLHLRDSVADYTLVYELSPDTTEIVQRQGYCPFKGKTFRLADKTWHRPEHAYFFDFDEVNYPFDDYRKQKKPNPCPAGRYQFRIRGNFPHELVLTEEGTFSYYVMGNRYLEGNVSRIGNLLELRDNCIKEPFYVLIEKDGLVPYLPGLFGKEKSINTN